MKKSLPRTRESESGFSLLELMIAAAIFILLCGAAFGLLAVSQTSYQNESQALSSFQDARLGLDQMLRDINVAGFPPAAEFSTLPTDFGAYASTPFAWPGTAYITSPCIVGSTCVTNPSDFDLIIETDPMNSGAVKWIHYKLVGTTLMRGVANKTAGQDPDSSSADNFVPFVQNVMNNASDAQVTQFQALYPAMYSNGRPPIFAYTCDIGTGPQSCSTVSGTPVSIRDVEITLIVMAPLPDSQGRPRLVQLNGRAHRVNPNQ